MCKSRDAVMLQVQSLFIALLLAVAVTSFAPGHSTTVPTSRSCVSSQIILASKSKKKVASEEISVELLEENGLLVGDKADAVSNESQACSAKKKKRKRISEKEPFYWFNATDRFILESDGLQNQTFVRSMRFSIYGNPRPLRRHRTARGFMYNPSSKYQESFRQVVHLLIQPNVEEETQLHQPLFPEDAQLAMSLVFHLKRPKKHFVNGTPGPGRLRTMAPPRLSPLRPDIDNLAKFVLDSLNGLVYVDDRQVVSITATKLLHDEGDFQGCTQVRIQRLVEDDLDALLESKF